MRWTLAVAAALVALLSPSAAQNADNRLPGETASEGAMPVIRDLINRGEPLPRAIGTTHVCGDIYPADGPAVRPKAGPLLGYRITTEGELENITVVRTSGSAALDKAAIACAHRWKYIPARSHGRPLALDWQNNVAWTNPEPAAPPSDIVIQVDAPPPTNVITTQSRVRTPPPISAPASIGKPHVCIQDYPKEAVAAGMQGTTTIGFTITEQGTVQNVHVVTSSGYAMLDDAAVRCAAQWLYKPAIENSKPVAVPWRAQVKWALHQGPLPGEYPVATGAPHDCSGVYPAEARMPRAQSTTDVSFTVAADGSVKNVAVTKSSGSKLLDDAFVACVARWRYSPAQKDGKPIDVPWQAAIAWTPRPQ